MTSWSGGVKTGCPRVKNLSKFSAPLPHCGEKRKERSVGVPPPTPGAALRGAGRGLRPLRRDEPWRVCGRAAGEPERAQRSLTRSLAGESANSPQPEARRGNACRGAGPAALTDPVSCVPPTLRPALQSHEDRHRSSGPRVPLPAGRPGRGGMRTAAPDLRGWGPVPRLGLCRCICKLGYSCLPARSF